jgi:predicted phosphoribosyltransferase/dienelactone hydrolase
VPVAYEVAKALGASLDLLLVRKLGVPGQRELAMGAMASGGIRVLNTEVIEALGITEEAIEQVAAVESEELSRRARVYRGERPFPEVAGRCVLLVDDGLATGATMRAAMAAVRQQGPARLVVGVPVAPPSTIALLRQEADEVVCPATPEPFFGISRWYKDFTQVSDDEVRRLLAQAWQKPPAQAEAVPDTAGRRQDAGTITRTEVTVHTEAVSLAGDVALPDGTTALVVFAHGSGSSRHSPRNRAVAKALNQAGLGTLLFDLLTPEEERVDLRTRALRFDIALLTTRLVGAIDWVRSQSDLQALRIGLFGASTGAAAAIMAAVQRPESVHAVVSRGGRPDLADAALSQIRVPLLLIVGGEDTPVLALHRATTRLLQVEHQLAIIPGATHLFEEPGALDEVARLACDWFVQHLVKQEGR